MQEPDLTVPEVAEQLDVAPDTILQWIEQGRFPNARKESGVVGWRVPRPDVDSLRGGGDQDVALGLETPRNPSG